MLLAYSVLLSLVWAGTEGRVQRLVGRVSHQGERKGQASSGRPEEHGMRHGCMVMTGKMSVIIFSNTDYF